MHGTSSFLFKSLNGLHWIIKTSVSSICIVVWNPANNEIDRLIDISFRHFIHTYTKASILVSSLTFPLIESILWSPCELNCRPLSAIAHSLFLQAMTNRSNTRTFCGCTIDRLLHQDDAYIFITGAQKHSDTPAGKTYVVYNIRIGVKLLAFPSLIDGTAMLTTSMERILKLNDDTANLNRFESLYANFILRLLCLLYPRSTRLVRNWECYALLICIILIEKISSNSRLRCTSDSSQGWLGHGGKAEKNASNLFEPCCQASRAWTRPCVPPIYWKRRCLGKSNL